MFSQTFNSLRPRLLSLAVASSMAAISGVVSAPAQASDLEIYAGATAGKPTITLMLDSSQSMSKKDKVGDPIKLQNLQDGVKQLVSDTSLFNEVNIGVGIFPIWISDSLGAQNTGVIKLEASNLDKNHSDKIIEVVEDMVAQGKTPAAQAYAEAGAYLMGTNTTNKYSSTITWYEYRGYNLASSSVPKVDGHYVAPKANECGGQAIYFLTDGQPNASSKEIAKTLMDSALTPNTGSTKLTTDCSKFSSLGGDENSGWSCMLDFADKLLDKKNPKGAPIKTATVGFGSAYSSLKEAKTLEDCDKASGDVKRLCTLGIKGQGGFYYAESSDDIVKSIKSLIGKVSSDIKPVSTGTISIPLDSLGTFKSRNFAYLPILDPKPGDNNLWKGNLKKYNVVNTTIKGKNNKFVFKDSKGLFATNTWDLWNTINDAARKNPGAKGEVTDGIPDDALRPDEALPQVGGTFQKVFENNNSTRNLFVNSNGSLKNLKVVNNKPKNFNGLNGYDSDQKIALLSFMGYKLPKNKTAVEDGKAVSAQNKWLKNVGGVLHSVPQLITTTIDIDSKTGQLQTTDKNGKDISNRKDYLLYGSMDGALHMVNDKTGKETFTFVPKQILDLQPDALKGSGTTINGSYPYGVDGPWEVFANYKVDSDKYKASQIFAMGGLRMGGSTYYALDITDVTTPKLIYSVGSNYANRLQGDKTSPQGIKNDTMGTNAEQNALSHMGQSWAKPTIGYVKSGGKKVMVNFLPGGYDTCYEDPKFQLNTTNTDAKCNNKASAQGNAMYMVQVGEQKTDSPDVDTSKNNGKLLWWASNQGSGDDSTTRSSSLQYSKQNDLKHSIVTQVRTLDRNYDGLTDHIYFADLGGQVWRVDINNNKDTDNFKIDRVVKILDVSNQVGTDDAPPRFYERPLVTFYNGKDGVMAMVTVGTGDRSSPVNIKSARTKPDALYSFYDKDVTRVGLFNYHDNDHNVTLTTSELTVSDLAPLTFAAADANAKTGIQAKMQNNTIQGWYMQFTHWDGKDAKTTGDKYKLKMFNEPDALASVLILSTYNPDAGNTAGECSAGVKGQTQRERACLPYGVCLDRNGKAINTSRSTKLSGVGISDNYITQYQDTPIFTSIKNRCEGDDCKPKEICPSGDCDDSCTGSACGTDAGVNTDQRINPLAWMEHQQ